MTQEFNERVESITKDDDVDDTGQLAVGAIEFFREVFDERGRSPSASCQWRGANEN